MDFERKIDNKEQEDSVEVIKIILDHIIQEAEEIGRGNNGIVLKLNIPQEDFLKNEHITKEALAEYFKKVFDLSDEKVKELMENPTAGKILKIYMPGLAKAEFNGQTNVAKMTEILDSSDSAKVPKTFFFYTMESISEELHKKMSTYGKESNSLDIFFMEYIDDAIELREYIYRKIIDKCAKLSDLKNDNGTYKGKKEIYDRVGEFLGIKSHSKMSFNDEMDPVVKFLKENNINIEDEILDKIEKTMNYLNNEKNVFHNDLHDRNILIKKVNGKFMVYIIDWATVARKQIPGRIDDNAVVEKIRASQHNY